MHNILNPEGPVMSFITKITYSAYLNLLWLICCLPIVTAGASTTALFYVTLKVAKNEEGSLTKSFFHSFRENFRQATKIWLFLLAAGIVFAFDGYVFSHMRFENTLWTIGAAVFLVALAAYAIILMYIFPLLARFDNTTFAMFKNSLFSSLAPIAAAICCFADCAPDTAAISPACFAAVSHAPTTASPTDAAPWLAMPPVIPLANADDNPPFKTAFAK